MALRFRRLREISRFLPQLCPGNPYQLSRRAVTTFALHLNYSQYVWANINGNVEERGCHAQRFSTVPDRLHEPVPKVDLLSFIESTFDELEGRYHCWLNRVEDSKNLFRRNGVFLVLAGAFLEKSFISGCDPIIMFEKVKTLQQRYPSLHVMGFQSSSPSFTDAVRTRLLQIMMREYITFPILLSNKEFPEMTDGPCYIIFKDFKSPLLFHESHVDLGIIDKAIKELNVQQNENLSLAHNLKSSWVKQIEVIKEPHDCSSLRNLLLYFPGCISVDESGNRLFLSDVNHHRIIVFDGNGKILCCIGSSPGFEDGDFESAKLLRPAASFYHVVEDCLYIVDSGNHAIRKADMKRRVLDTFYPTSNTDMKSKSLWSWIMDKFWMKREIDPKSAEFNSESFLFPWHLMESSDDNFFIFNRSFETLWIMDLASGVIKDVVKGFPKILEICGQMILEKVSLLKQIPGDWFQQQVDTYSLEGIPHAGLVSSLATFRDNIVICDAVGQSVWKVNRESGLVSNFQWSNFGVLGLPYWLSFPLERVYAVGDVLSTIHTDHAQCFSLLPGRIDIRLNIDVPEDTELVEPLQEGCVWCQARGAAIEVSSVESKEASPEKVGAAQQWYDELDNLAFSSPEVDMILEEEKTTSAGEVQVGKICMDCAINTSPGTSEVIIYAALYLRMKQNPNSCKEGQERKAARIAEILNLNRSGWMGEDPCIQLLLKSNTDPGELIFLKPLHVRLKFHCRDHLKAENSKAIILTDSSIVVDVSL